MSEKMWETSMSDEQRGRWLVDILDAGDAYSADQVFKMALRTVEREALERAAAIAEQEAKYRRRYMDLDAQGIRTCEDIAGDIRKMGMSGDTGS